MLGLPVEMNALPRVDPPRVRRRWPSTAFVLGVITLSLVVWRVATTRAIGTLPPAGVPLRVVRAIDGDTLLLEGDVRVRLLGVNTPETKQPDRPAELFGPQAYDYTRSLVDQRTVSLEYDRERVDNYRRVLAYVYLDDGSMLNQRLIETGYSPAVLGFPIRSDRRRLFEEVEQVAQAGVLGIWTLPEWQDRLREQRERRDRSRR